MYITFMSSNRRISSDVVSVNPNEMPETVRHKNGAHVSSHHVVDVAFQHAKILQMNQNDALSQAMIIDPANA